VTIHSEHPFLEPESSRDPARRLRGRLGGAVTLLTTFADGDRAGLTVSSVMVGHGDPAHLLVMVDPESDLAGLLTESGRGVIAILSWEDRDLADAFAGVAPAPGGPFRMASWTETQWGPLLDGCSAWAGFRLEDQREVGWSLLLDGVIEEIGIGEDRDPLVHRRGRYQRPS
jgi:flavin reductase (DIM6/NTAB) family NADH-FMN oxidoreductase RutF